MGLTRVRLSPTAHTQIPDAFHGMGYAHYKVQAPKISLLQERTQKFSLSAAPRSPPRPARLHPLGGRGTSPATSAHPLSSKQRNLASAALRRNSRRARSSADVPMAAPPSPTGAVGHMTAAFTSPEEKSITSAAEPDRSGLPAAIPPGRAGRATPVAPPAFTPGRASLRTRLAVVRGVA